MVAVVVQVEHWRVKILQIEWKKFIGDRYDYSKIKYQNFRTKVVILCPEHGKVSQSAPSCFSGVGCKKCNENYSGFSRQGYIDFCNMNYKGVSNLYFIELSNDTERFYKFGITCRTLKERFASLKEYKIKEISLYSSLDAGLIFDLEKYLLSVYKNIQYIPHIIFGGSTECFSKIPDDYEEKIQNFIDSYQS